MSLNQRFFKVLHKTNQHYDMVYKPNAWNKDILDWHPYGSCESGGLYFAPVQDIFEFLDYGNGVCEVLDWEDDRGNKYFYKDPEGKKVKAHKILLGIKAKYSYKVFKNLIDLGAPAKSYKLFAKALDLNITKLIKELLILKYPNGDVWSCEPNRNRNEVSVALESAISHNNIGIARYLFKTYPNIVKNYILNTNGAIGTSWLKLLVSCNSIAIVDLFLKHGKIDDNILYIRFPENTNIKMFEKILDESSITVDEKCLCDMLNTGLNIDVFKVLWRKAGGKEKIHLGYRNPNLNYTLLESMQGLVCQPSAYKFLMFFIQEGLAPELDFSKVEGLIYNRYVCLSYDYKAFINYLQEQGLVKFHINPLEAL